MLAREDSACARPEYERAILATVRDKGRLALVGDRRLGKSTLIERTLASRAEPTLREVQALIPQLRDEERYAAALMQVCSRLPAELRVPA